MNQLDKFSLIVLLLRLVVASANAYGQSAPTWLWARPTNGPAVVQALKVAADANGNIYQWGSFGRTAQIGTTVLTNSATSFNGFLAKYNSVGTAQWAIQSTSVSANSFVGGTALATDANGNAYIAGSFSGTIMFESTMLTANGVYNGFIAKVNGQGMLQWVMMSSGSSASSQAFVSGLATDANGNLFAVGRFSEVVTYGSVSAVSRGSSDVYLLKIDAAGVPQWIQSGGSAGADFSNSVAVGPNGTIYLSGTLAGNATFGALSATSLGGTDAFLAAYDAQGNPQWESNFGGSADDAGGGVDVTTSGEIYNVGRFQGTAGFNSIFVSSRGLNDGYIVKCSAQGRPLWANQMGGSGNDQASSVSVKDGVPYVAGQFSGTASFSSQSKVSLGNTDIFTARYTPTGALVWVEATGSIGTDTDAGIAVSSNGIVYTGGQYSNTVQVGPFSLANQGSINSYLAAIRDNLPTAVVLNRSDKQFSLYPNPVGSTGITITLPGQYTEDDLIEVLDVMGRLVKSTRTASSGVSDRRIIISTADLTQGQYMIRYQSGNSIVCKKFTVL